MQKKRKAETTSWNSAEVRRREAQAKETPARTRTKKKKFNWLIYIAGVLASSFLLAGLAWLFVNDVCAFNKDPHIAVVEIAEEDGLGDVATKLKKAGLIEFKWLFSLYGMVSGAMDDIDPGSYELNTDMDYRALVAKMYDDGEPELDTENTVNVTIPEGYTVLQIIDLLAEKGVGTKEDLREAAANYEFKDYDFIDKDRLGEINRLEGFLFPDTYQFFTNRSAVLAFDTMLLAFKNQITDEMMSDIKDSGYTLAQIVNMASLIEKEAIGDQEERRNIGSVLYNRLSNPSGETGGYLQLDSTVYYALELEGRPKTDFSTSLDSKHNTYKYRGLPKGPICNPSLESIMAAIYPTDTSYYFFAYGKDGVSHFFKTYREHLNFVNSSMYAPTVF